MELNMLNKAVNVYVAALPVFPVVENTCAIFLIFIS